MSRTRRGVLFFLAAGPTLLLGRAQPPGYPRLPLPNPGKEENPRLPNGKLQKDAIAQQEHKDALKDTDRLIATAKELKAELEKAGDYVVPVSAIKKTKQIERLARKIRGRLKG